MNFYELNFIIQFPLLKKFYLSMINIVLVLCCALCHKNIHTWACLEKLKKIKIKKSRVGENSFNYLIHYTVIIFNILRVMLIYKNSFDLSTCNVSDVFSSVNLQVFRGRKLRQFSGSCYLLLYINYYRVTRSI